MVLSALFVPRFPQEDRRTPFKGTTLPTETKRTVSKNAEISNVAGAWL
jgi:hypothetical protein